MKRLFFAFCLLLMLIAPSLLPAAQAGHAIVGNGQVVQCDCGCPPPCVCDPGEQPVEKPTNCPR